MKIFTRFVSWDLLLAGGVDGRDVGAIADKLLNFRCSIDVVVELKFGLSTLLHLIELFRFWLLGVNLIGMVVVVLAELGAEPLFVVFSPRLRRLFRVTATGAKLAIPSTPSTISSSSLKSFVFKYNLDLLLIVSIFVMLILWKVFLR